MKSSTPHPDSQDQRFFARLKQTGACTWLLLALVLLLCMNPFLDGSLGGRLLLGILNSAVLVAGALAVSQSRRTLVLALGLALPALGIQWFSLLAPSRQMTLLLGFAVILFYAFTISKLLSFVLRPGAVTGNKLHGAIDTYILMGLMWAMIYVVIEQLAPGSFVFPHNAEPVDNHFPQLLFFSFTTLTTTGYGDTVPVSGYAQATVMIEQLAGTFYVAILIARLAGLYQPNARGGRPGREP